MLQQQTLARQYLNQCERAQRELEQCQGYLQVGQWGVGGGPPPLLQGQRGVWTIIAASTPVVNPDIAITVTTAAPTTAAAAADAAGCDVRNDDYAENHTSAIINNNNNHRNNNSYNHNEDPYVLTPPVPPSPTILSNNDATATAAATTHTLLLQQIQSLQADLVKKEQVRLTLPHRYPFEPSSSIVDNSKYYFLSFAHPFSYMAQELFVLHFLSSPVYSLLYSPRTCPCTYTCSGKYMLGSTFPRRIVSSGSSGG